MPGETIELSGSQTLTVTAETAEALEVESVWSPSEGAVKRPPRHLHPHQTETFRVVEGELTVRVGSEQARVIGAGEELVIPPGTPHCMWNASDAATKAIWRVEPAQNTLDMFRFIAAGMSPLRSVRMLWRFRREFRLSR